MGHDPTGCHVVQAAEQSEKFFPAAVSVCQRAKYIGTSTVAMKATYPANPAIAARMAN